MEELCNIYKNGVEYSTLPPALVRGLVGRGSGAATHAGGRAQCVVRSWAPSPMTGGLSSHMTGGLSAAATGASRGRERGRRVMSTEMSDLMQLQR
jgi:hypothetical protein